MTDCPSQYSPGRALVVVAGVENSVAAIEGALARGLTARETQSLLVQTEQVLSILRRHRPDDGALHVPDRAVAAARDALSAGETALATVELGDAVRALRDIEV